MRVVHRHGMYMSNVIGKRCWNRCGHMVQHPPVKTCMAELVWWSARWMKNNGGGGGIENAARAMEEKEWEFETCSRTLLEEWHHFVWWVHVEC